MLDYVFFLAQSCLFLSLNFDVLQTKLDRAYVDFSLSVYESIETILGRVAMSVLQRDHSDFVFPHVNLFEIPLIVENDLSSVSS